MTRKSYVSRIFGSSPIKPIQRHMEKVHECADQLCLFFQAVLRDNWEEAERIQQRISEIENEADDIKKDIRLSLPKGIFMPVSRIDLLEMLRIQDSVANKAKDIAGLMLGRRMSLPKEIGKDVLEFVTRSVAATKQAQVAINELDELVETGFRGAEVSLVQAMIKELDAIEKDTDEKQVVLRANLFKIEDSLPPVRVVFLYKIIEWIGEIADLSQRVGSRLEYLLAH